MKKALLAGLAVVIVIAAGLWAYDFVLGPTEEASGPITAPPAGIAAGTVPTGPADVTENRRFVINPAESTVSFEIYEELRGKPTNVIGTTNQLAGEVEVNLNDLAVTRIGPIRINARTLATDNDRRNQAIRNRILSTDQYEYITFVPMRTIGLEGAASAGTPVKFQVEGELTVRDVTRPVVFDAEFKLEDETRISGTAETVINKGDYDVSVPNLPFLANVGEEVKLTIKAVAVAETTEPGKM